MRSTRHKLKLLRGGFSSVRTASSANSSSNRHRKINSNNNTILQQSPMPLVTHPLNSNNNNNNIHTKVYDSSGAETESIVVVQTPRNCLTTNNSNNTTIHQHPTRTGNNQVAAAQNCLESDFRMDPGLTSDIRVKAFGICRDYLHGAWSQIDCRDLVVKRVSGGLSNYLYHCSLPSTVAPINNEPTQVLLRFYGQVHGEHALESLITESVIFTLLSERKLGPRLYGIFPGGRVEQFIPARPLLTPELRDPELSCLIAQKMAQIHGLNIPISKEPTWLWGTMDRWMANIRENLRKISLQDPIQKEIVQRLIDYNLEDELQWLKQFLPSIQSPVVFSHNDLQEGNILIRPGYEIPEDKLVLIDFEYCSYNYRGFDLANHFCEWSYNYNVDAYPNFSHEPSDLPSHDEMMLFIRTYVETLRREYQMNFSSETDEEFLTTSPLFNEEHIIKEIEAFTLASHFFWSLWAVVNAQVSKIPFGYWEYGLCRLETYFSHKKTLIV